MKLGKAIWYVAGLLMVVALGLFIATASRLLASAAPSAIDFVDVVVIVLAALSIMITVLGIFIALLGVVGWATFEAKLRDSSLDYFKEQLGRDGPLRQELESLLVEISLEGVERATPTPPESGGLNDAGEGEYVE